MSYIALGASAAAQADKAVADAQKWNEQYEQHAGSVDPEVKAYLVMRDSVFALADQLGIGQQVRVLYHTTAVSAKAGMVGGTVGGAGLAVAEQAVQGAGSAVAAQYSSAIGTGAAIGMTAGAVVGVATALFSLFSDDSEAAERAKRKAERGKAQALLLSRLGMPDLIKEQQHNAAAARRRANYARSFLAKFDLFPASISKEVVGDPVLFDKAATAADALVMLYQQIGQRFKPADLKMFESSANMQRWQSALAANEAAIQQYAKMLPGGAIQEGSQEFSKNLRARITTETKVFHDLAVARKKTPFSLSKGLLTALFPKKLTIPVTHPGMSPAAGVITGLAVVGSGLAIFHMSRKTATQRTRGGRKA